MEKSEEMRERWKRGRQEADCGRIEKGNRRSGRNNKRCEERWRGDDEEVEEEE